MARPTETIRITSLTHDGRGVGAAASGRTVFVPGALPGQRISCDVVEDRGRYLEGELTEVLDSPELARPICRHWKICGGCVLQRMPYSEQLFWKQNLLQNAMTRIGRLSSQQWANAWNGVLSSLALTCFRNKLTLAFGARGRKLVLGMRRRKSHVVTPVACPLISASGQPIITQAALLAPRTGIPPELFRFLTIRQCRTLDDEHSSWNVILLTSQLDKSQSRKIAALGEQLLASIPALNSFHHEERYRDDTLAVGERRILSLKRAPSPICLSLGGKLFAMDVTSFFQVNDEASELLANTAKKMALSTTGKMLDLYSGVGSPGQLLDGHFQCTGLEYSRQSVTWARFNAELHGLTDWNYVSGDAATLLTRMDPGKEQFSTVLADPPREGIQKKALDRILEFSPAHIIYISCNPATLARDSARLLVHYDIQAIQAVDMFPHTPHLETCTLWKRK